MERHATLTGRVDVVVADGERLEVIDYKTADDSRNESEALLQLVLYALGLIETGRKVTSARIMYVRAESAEERKVAIDRKILDQAREGARHCLELIMQGKFLPRPDAQCTKCDVRKICYYRSSRIPRAVGEDQAKSGVPRTSES